MKVAIYQRIPGQVPGTAEPLSLLPGLLAADCRSHGLAVELHYLDSGELRHRSRSTETAGAGCAFVALDGSFSVDVIREFSVASPAPAVLLGDEATHVFANGTGAVLVVRPLRTSFRLFCHAIEEAANGGQQPFARAGGWFVTESFGEHLAEIPNLLFRTRPEDGKTRTAERPADPETGNATKPGLPGTIDGSRTFECADSGMRSECVDPFHPELPATWTSEDTVSVDQPMDEIRLLFAALHQPLRTVRTDAQIEDPLGANLPRVTDRARGLISASRLAMESESEEPRPEPQRHAWRRSTARPQGASSLVQSLEEQIEYLWTRGRRTFAIEADNPWPALGSLLDRLAKTDHLPASLRVFPSAASLRTEEPAIRALVERARSLPVRLGITGITFPGFHERTLDWLAPGRTHWDERWTARFLRDLERTGPDNVTATQGHWLVLFDPWTTLDELEEDFASIDEDAPFLRDAVTLESCLALRDPYGPLTDRVRQAGLLEEIPTGTGFRFRYADTRVQRFRELARQGLVPLFESVARLRPRHSWPALLAEARFRWFRELVAVLREGSDPPPEERWGRIVAGVVHRLERDPLGQPPRDRRG